MKSCKIKNFRLISTSNYKSKDIRGSKGKSHICQDIQKSIRDRNLALIILMDIAHNCKIQNFMIK